MMTNFAALIFFTVTTNGWRTTHTVHPYVEPSEAVLAIYRPSTKHQVGTVMSNTVARVEWNGKQRDVILESVPIGTANRVELY